MGPTPSTESGEDPQGILPRRIPAAGVKDMQVWAGPRDRAGLEQGGRWRPRKEPRQGAAENRRHWKCFSSRAGQRGPGGGAGQELRL